MSQIPVVSQELPFSNEWASPPQTTTSDVQAARGEVLRNTSASMSQCDFSLPFGL
ncbi:hypothetical protein CBOM_01250 [Ceraceosorus bombacis]|uniref:Uncharacterized protein n=1 Tax=Ceraceosorus bombacis TaxID=401625 RepID=A0A0P1BB36_9BASI|nr:hypothetical protein CBOM_01250 [Ceraceosorus bombacis]